MRSNSNNINNNITTTTTVITEERIPVNTLIPRASSFDSFNNDTRHGYRLSSTSTPDRVSPENVRQIRIDHFNQDYYRRLREQQSQQDSLTTGDNTNVTVSDLLPFYQNLNEPTSNNPSGIPETQIPVIGDRESLLEFHRNLTAYDFTPDENLRRGLEETMALSPEEIEHIMSNVPRLHQISRFPFNEVNMRRLQERVSLNRQNSTRSEQVSEVSSSEVSSSEQVVNQIDQLQSSGETAFGTILHDYFINFPLESLEHILHFLHSHHSIRILVFLIIFRGALVSLTGVSIWAEISYIRIRNIIISTLIYIRDTVNIRQYSNTIRNYTDDVFQVIRNNDNERINNTYNTQSSIINRAIGRAFEFIRRRRNFILGIASLSGALGGFIYYYNPGIIRQISRFLPQLPPLRLPTFPLTSNSDRGIMPQANQDTAWIQHLHQIIDQVVQILRDFF